MNDNAKPKKGGVPKGYQPIEFYFDKDSEYYTLRINDENIFPLQIVVPEKAKRLLEFKHGKKGMSLFTN